MSYITTGFLSSNCLYTMRMCGQFCDPATVYFSGHSTSKHSPGDSSGLGPALYLVMPTREQGSERNRRSCYIVSGIAYRTSRQSRQQSQGVRASSTYLACAQPRTAAPRPAQPDGLPRRRAGRRPADDGSHRRAAGPARTRPELAPLPARSAHVHSLQPPRSGTPLQARLRVGPLPCDGGLRAMPGLRLPAQPPSPPTGPATDEGRERPANSR